MTGPVVVVGDTLLDRDVEGVVNRLCPDSPVPVLDEIAHVDRPGGAGLSAVFAAAQGAEVVLVTALADDAGGARLSVLLAAAGVQVYPLRLAGATPEKIRLRSGGRVLLRHDRGRGGAARPGAASVVVVSDYGARWHAAGAAGGLASIRVPGANLVTPNEAEVRELMEAPGAGGRGDARRRRRAAQPRRIDAADGARSGGRRGGHLRRG